MFSRVMDEGQDGLNQEIFDRLKHWYGIEISSLTIFLFWIDPRNFLPIDKNTTTLLKENNIIEHRPRSYKDYLNLLPLKNDDIYINTARYSYGRVGDSSFLELYKKSRSYIIPQLISDSVKDRVNSFDFKLIAIALPEKENKEHFNVLKPDSRIVFYQCFTFNEDGSISYHPEHDLQLFNVRSQTDNTDRLKINISAIVGKNGSGKSTITELLYKAFNNLAITVLPEAKLELEYLEDFQLDIYYHSIILKKIQLRGKKIDIIEYSRIENTYQAGDEIVVDRDVLSDFFYSIAINYSLHALNEEYIGEWVKWIFEKNDAYQVPIVINPMRHRGNINIQKENDFAKSRLLMNILQPVGSNPEKASLRTLTENGRNAQLLKLTLNTNKTKYLYKLTEQTEIKMPSKSVWGPVIEKVFSSFNIPESPNGPTTETAKKYIYKKLINIARNYPKKYGRFVHADTIKQKTLSTYLLKLNEDYSHITFKLRQAINYLKYFHLKAQSEITVETYSNEIEKILINRESNEKDLSYIHLIPPPFINVEIELDDGSSFTKLSSGEKQRIYSINTLIYHLININSVSDVENEDGFSYVKYPYVNVILDEIELYFHPDMQRTFIWYLLDFLERTELENIFGLNIIAVTHSPFILSDIPNKNIVFLERNSQTGYSEQRAWPDFDIKSFGANVHELLVKGFFFENGFMGEFARKKIQSALAFLKNKIKPEEGIKNKDGLLEHWEKDDLKNFISIIGEPLIKNSLMELWNLAYLNEEEIDKEIERLKNQKEEIKKRNMP